MFLFQFLVIVKLFLCLRVRNDRSVVPDPADMGSLIYAEKLWLTCTESVA